MKDIIIMYLIIVVLAVSNIYCYAKSFKKVPIIESPKMIESIDPPKKIKITLRRMNCPDYKCENWTEE